MKIPIAYVAQILGTTLAKAHNKFHGGEIDLEDLIEYVEKRSSHPAYNFRVETIKRFEKNYKPKEA